MTIDQLHTLDENEIIILWYCINKIEPPILSEQELTPEMFPIIDHRILMDKLTGCKLSIKDEYQELFDGLISKLKVT